MSWTKILKKKGKRNQLDQTSADGSQAPDTEAVKEMEVGAMFDMDPYVVNLNEAGGKRYLKAKIEIEYRTRELFT